MATNFGNSPLLHYTTLDTFPKSSLLTGTVSAGAGSVYITGTGTLFLSEIDGASYGYLWNGTDEWREIEQVTDNTHISLLQGFTNALVGATVKWVPYSRAYSVSFLDVAGGGGKIDGVTLVDGESGTWDVNYPTQPNIDPHIIDGSSGAIDLTVAYT